MGYANIAVLPETRTELKEAMATVARATGKAAPYHRVISAALAVALRHRDEFLAALEQEATE